jgi:hypothetical protein
MRNEKDHQAIHKAATVMSRTVEISKVVAAAAIGGALLTGCAAPSKPLYQWQGYQGQVYKYFKGEPKEAQVAELERGLEKIKSDDGAVPPGYHAHLGLLYSNLGKDDQMAQEFQTEKALFPEATTYIDFLMKNANKGAN